MLEIDFYNIAMIAAATAIAGMGGIWFYTSKMIENEREQSQKIERELDRTKNLEKELQLNLSNLMAENKRLKTLFEIPTVVNKIDHNDKWSSLSHFFESQLSRLSRESKDVVSAVGSMKTALPIAMEQLSGLSAKLYVAAAVSTMNAADNIAKELSKELKLRNDASVLQVTVEIAEELVLKVARLDLQKDGLVFLCAGKQTKINETVWMRTLLTLHTAPELIGKISILQEKTKAANSQVPELPIIRGLSLPSTLITSLSCAGISNLIYYPDDANTHQEDSTNWLKEVYEALRRIPKGQNPNVTFKIRLFNNPETEIVLNKVSSGWLVIETDLTKPDPWRLIEQVMGFLRFKGQKTSLAV
jgi:hypothetical protein